MTQLDQTPLSETAFYILLALLQPLHGYGIIKHVAALTHDHIVLGAGTVYGTLKKLERSRQIRLVDDKNGRKRYQITPLGRAHLEHDYHRLQTMVHHAEVLTHHENA